MEVTKSVQTGLGGAAQLDDTTFKNLALLAFDTAVKGEQQKSSSSVMKKVAGDPTAVKSLAASLLSCVIEAAKNDLSGQELGAALRDSGLADDRAKLVADAFDSKKTKVRSALGLVGLSFPRVIDVGWRLDYQLRSSSTGKVRSQLYLITLRTMDAHGREGEKQFTCTVEQLQDLLAKCEDAKAQVDRVLKQTG